MNFKVSKKDALVIVDIQNDFCPKGALPVPDGDKVVYVINDYIEIFMEAGAQIYATRDWHPPKHISFKSFGGIWPSHCIQGSDGAEFHPDVKLPLSTNIISKATETMKEAYSGFDETNLYDMMKEKGIKRVFIGGLATDYCVKNTVLDSLKLGYETVLLADATLGVNVKPNDSKRAITEMIEEGAKIMSLSSMLESIEEIGEEKSLEAVAEEI